MRKIISFLLCAVIFLSAIPANASNSENVERTVVNNSVYSIIDALPFESDKPMNKGEASYYLAKLANASGNPRNIYFEDVRQENPYFLYVNFVFEQGLFERKNNRFYPETEITVREFFEAVLKLAGYEDYIKIKKTSYEQVMTELKLSKKISSGYDDKITAENFEEILFTAVNMPECIFNFSNYIISEDNVVVEKYRDINKFEGRIVGNENVSIYGYNITQNGCVLFEAKDGNLYRLKCGSLIISDIIGLKLEIFTDKNDTLLYCHVKNDNSKTVIVNGDDVSEIKPDMSQLRYTNEKGRGNTIKFSDETVFVYNGKNCYGVIPSYFNSGNSRTKAIDFEDDGIYDIVFVEQYISIITQDINAKTYSLTDLCTSSTYRFDDFDGIITVKDGKIIPFSDILKEQVVSIAISLDGKFATLYVSEQIVYASLDAKDEETLTVANTKYRYSNKADIANMHLGMEYEFGINYYGYISCFKKMADSELAYGYLVNIRKVKEDIRIRVLTSKNEYKQFILAEKVRINDQKYDIDDITPLFTSAGKTVHQLIKYSLDVNGNVKKLYYAPAVNSPIMNDSFVGLFYNKHYAQGSSYMRSSTISMEYLMGAETKKFVIVTDTLGNLMEERSFCLNVGFNRSKPDMKIYDAGKNRVVGAFVITMNVNDITTYISMSSSNYRGFLVAKKTVGLDRYGDICTYIEGWQEGAYRRYYAPEGGNFNNIDKGDLLILDYFDYSNVLYKYRKIFTLNSDANDGVALPADKSYTATSMGYYNYSASDATSSLVTMFGNVVTVDGMLSNPLKPLIIKCKGATDNNSDVACMLNVNTSRVYAYYTDSGEVKLSYYTALKNGDDVFVYCRDGAVIDVVVLR